MEPTHRLRHLSFQQSFVNLIENRRIHSPVPFQYGLRAGTALVRSVLAAGNGIKRRMEAHTGRAQKSSAVGRATFRNRPVRQTCGAQE